MTTARMGRKLLAGCLAVCGSATAADAAPTVAQMLSFRPKQEVAIATPTAAEHESCKVELLKLAKGSGWVLRDPRGQLVRRYADTNGDNQIDVWSYYQNGKEVYREVDTNANQKADQYRWLNTAGCRWGVDVNEDGKIDGWKMISPEEVSQEALQAVLTRDFARLQALMISEADMKALEMPEAEASRIRAAQKQARDKFDKTCAAIPESGAKWIQLETGVPHCAPADETGMRVEYIRHPRGTVMYDAGGKSDFLQTGELIQVGMAWRLVDAPTPGHDAQIVGSTPGAAPVTPEVQPLLQQLQELDARAPQATGTPSAEVVRYQLKRADILEQIAAKVKIEDRDQWTRQVADCLNAAVTNSPAEKAAYERLAKLAEQAAAAQPGGAVAGYVAYREIQADYAVRQNGDSKDFIKTQTHYVERLTKFVQDYPKADDAADALLQLGMAGELMGKETEAKKWYEQLVANFADKKALVEKAAGAIRRLTVEGKPLELAGPTLEGGSFDMSQVKGKAAVVYYWASWNQQCVGDFARLKQLAETYGAKGLEVVCVNLDGSAEEALSFLRRCPAPGTHLFQAGGLESPLATSYGIMVLPNLFLVDKDGKVASRTVQIGTLEEEVKKLLK